MTQPCLPHLLSPEPATVPYAAPDFHGATYQRSEDHARLSGQLLRIYEVMRDGQWRTLAELSEQSGAPAASASAQLRNLKKFRFGGYTIEKRSEGDRSRGLWSYRLVLPKEQA